MARHLVLVGGGHAHLTALLRTDEFVRRGHEVTLVSESPHHYYSGMGPGLLAGIYSPQEVRFHVKKLVEDRGGAFVEGKVVRVHPDRRLLSLANGNAVSYDVVSFNTGSSIARGPVRKVGENTFPVKPIVNLLRARGRVLELLKTKRPKILVLGGGPAGLEIAGNVWRLVRDQGVQADIILAAGSRLLGDFPSKAQNLARQSLKSRGVKVIEGVRVAGVEDGTVVLSDGSTLFGDVLFICFGVRPSTLFSQSGLPTADDGGLLVNSRLQSPVHPDMFGGGDCIAVEGLKLAKVGVYAVRQNPVLYHNLLAALEGRTLREFRPGRNYLLIFNLGDGTGIFWRRNWVWSGRLAFRLKDAIDRRFMRRFQVSKERQEEV